MQLPRPKLAFLSFLATFYLSKHKVDYTDKSEYLPVERKTGAVVKELDRKLIKSTFEEIGLTSEEAGTLFYENLFRSAPRTREMFPANIDKQATKLFDTISLAVEHIDDLEPLDGALNSLGKRHSDMGVNAKDYSLVGEVLLMTLSDALGSKFDADAETAWKQFYRNIAIRMQTAA